MAITIPSIGATTRVYSRASFFLSTSICAWTSLAFRECNSARVVASIASADSKSSCELAFSLSIRSWRLKRSSACFRSACLDWSSAFTSLSAASALRKSLHWGRSSISAINCPLVTWSPCFTFSDFNCPDTCAPTFTRSIASIRPVARTEFSISPLRTGAVIYSGTSELLRKVNKTVIIMINSVKVQMMARWEIYFINIVHVFHNNESGILGFLS